jgi:hypothetical protein
LSGRSRGRLDPPDGFGAPRRCRLAASVSSALSGAAKAARCLVDAQPSPRTQRNEIVSLRGLPELGKDHIPIHARKVPPETPRDPDAAPVRSAGHFSTLRPRSLRRFRPIGRRVDYQTPIRRFQVRPGATDLRADGAVTGSRAPAVRARNPLATPAKGEMAALTPARLVRPCAATPSGRLDFAGLQAEHVSP